LRVKKQAMDNSITGIGIASADGRINYANAAFIRMWGASTVEELIEKRVDTLFVDPSLAGHRIEELLKTGFHTGEIESLRLDGSTFPVLYAANIVYDEAGQPVYMIGTYQDVSEQKKQQQLEQDRDVALRANEAKTRFLSSVSHELRTPLNAIMGFAQVLEMDSALHADHADLVKEILASGGSLVSLINQILEFARIETGEVGLSLEKLSSELAVLESLERVLPLAQERNIEIATCLDQAPNLTVLADHARLVDILGNFLSNAVKYNRESGNVEITVVPVADRVHFAVTDNGYGIPAEKQGELFLSFDRLGKEAGTEAGSGVGLALSKRLVEQMGGTIGFTSSPNVGSTFWAELPQG
ncbi:MAG: PAS domain-containing sensor histidine kinase, partial [Spirochaeta sp.]|nr:PAS domain-containing sensor histidine kinase [Spirochaeta sp.]